MRRATLIVNPKAGRAAGLARVMPEVMRLLEANEFAGTVVQTRGPGSAGGYARNAVSGGCDVVFACGGDGTIHEVLQGLAHSSTALGVVPAGTANALARHLGIALDPVESVRQQMSFAPRRVPLGKIQLAARGGVTGEEHYFAVMAGAGPDGALVYSLLAGRKAAMGRAAYYAHSARLFLTRRFSPFRVEYRMAGSDVWVARSAVSVMAVRVADLGGMFSRLTPRVTSPGRDLLQEETMRLLILRPPAVVSLPVWFAMSQVQLHRRNPWLEMVSVEAFRCSAGREEDRIHAQVDGEWIGGLPISVRMVPDAMWLLMPYSGLSSE